MQTLIKKTFFSLLVVVLISSVYSCSMKSKTDSLVQVNFRMKWFYTGTMTGWFAGKEKGFFKDEGLNLVINSGGPDNNSIKLVASGNDQFGIASADEVIIARSKGIPVVAVAVLFKDNPVCFITKKESGIKQVEDWSGKRAEVSYGDNSEVQYRSILKKYNLKSIKETPYTFNLIPFIENKVDISVAYIMDQVITLQQKGVDLNIFKPKDYGINPYGDVIITSQKIVEENPQLVSKFLKACMKSQKFAIDNPEESSRIFTDKNANLQYENELNIWKATIPYIVGDESNDSLFVMQLSRWEYYMQILEQNGFLKEKVEIERTYTNKFLETK